jgi:hypothetical protein
MVETVAASIAASIHPDNFLFSFLQIVCVCIYSVVLGTGLRFDSLMLRLWIYNEAMQQCSSWHSNAPTADVITL